MSFKHVWGILVLLLISGCGSTPSLYKANNQTSGSIYADDFFDDSIEIEQPSEIYEVTPEMVSLVDRYIAREKNYHDKARRLVEMIFDHNFIGLAYQNTATLTAIETFENKTANCLSLTIMAYALANKSGIDIRFQDVKVPEYWERNGDYNFLTGHVNLVITPRKNSTTAIVMSTRESTIDFDAQIARQDFPSKTVLKKTVTAMFYTNKGAQAIVDKNYDVAYTYLKAATMSDSNFSPAWGNLGVLYRLNGLEDSALKAYDKAIYLDDSNLTAINNLALLKFRLGNIPEANKLRAGLHRIRRSNPYYQALLASEAFHAGDYELAAGRYKRAIKINDKIHEFHFGLAKSLHYAGETRAAEIAMKKAIKLSPFPDTDEKYTAKLSKMRFLNQN